MQKEKYETVGIDTDIRTFVKYIHHDPKEPVFVDELLKGLHREHCLCYGPCSFFRPGEEDNCQRAQELYEFDKKWNMVTPVWECPKFELAYEIKP